jgi:hypothetical protein
MTTYTTKDVVVSYSDKVIDLTKFRLQNPVAINDGLHNTKVDIVPLLVSGVYNTSVFKYNRINLSTFGVISISKGSAIKVADLVERLGTDHGFYTRFSLPNGEIAKGYIGTEDLVNLRLPIVTGIQQQTFNVDAHYNSLLFYGTLNLKVSV